MTPPNRLAELLSWWRSAGADPADVAPRRPVAVVLGQRPAAEPLWPGSRVTTRWACPPSQADRLADELIDSGHDLLVVIDPPDAYPVRAAAVVAALDGHDEVDLLGFDSGLSDQEWMAAARFVRQFIRANASPADVLRTTAESPIGAAAAIVRRCGARRTPVLLDGLTSAAGALLAEAVQPGCRPWLAAAGVGVEPAHSAALEGLGLRALLDLGSPSGSVPTGLLALEAMWWSTQAPPADV